jgi:hypothetical protein
MVSAKPVTPLVDPNSVANTLCGASALTGAGVVVWSSVGSSSFSGSDGTEVDLVGSGRSDLTGPASTGADSITSPEGDPASILGRN